MIFWNLIQWLLKEKRTSYGDKCDHKNSYPKILSTLQTVIKIFQALEEKFVGRNLLD